MLGRGVKSSSLYIIYPIQTPRSSHDDILHVLGLALANVPSPASQGLDDLRGHGGGQRHAQEDEALVDGVGESELCPNT